MTSKAALLLFSGGQDSATCLAWALENFSRVETIGFEYGQRHSVEMDCRRVVRQKIVALRPDWASRLGDDHVFTLPALAQISDTALTRDSAIFLQESGLPSTFVPGRNLLFFTYAAALAYRRGIDDLVGGMCETDFSGYPDCRRSTLDAQEKTLRRGMEKLFHIHTPLMNLTKAQSWKAAHILGGGALVDLILEETHSCYLGARGTRHAWGYGCGTCPACELRAKGWREYQTTQQI